MSPVFDHRGVSWPDKLLAFLFCILVWKQCIQTTAEVFDLPILHLHEEARCESFCVCWGQSSASKLFVEIRCRVRRAAIWEWMSLISRARPGFRRLPGIRCFGRENSFHTSRRSKV